MISVPNIIRKIRSKLFKKKPCEPTVTEQFYTDNEEFLKYMVKYQDVFKAVVESVQKKEIGILNAEYPCKFRQDSVIPFRVQCACNIDGEKEKKLVQCEKCKFRQE